MTARVCDREHLSVSVRKIMCVCAHQVRENVCVRMCCVTLHFRADIEGPLFGRRVSASRMALSPQAQISLSYLTQQILCKSSRSVTGKLIISGSLHPLAFSPSILSLPL